MAGRVFAQVGLRQFEQSNRGTGAVFLQVNKRPGQLDQAFVKQTVRTLSLGQPKLFENFVGFEKKLAVKTLEIAKVMSVQVLALEFGNDRRNGGRLLVHGF